MLSLLGLAAFVVSLSPNENESPSAFHSNGSSSHYDGVRFAPSSENNKPDKNVRTESYHRSLDKRPGIIHDHRFSPDEEPLVPEHELKVYRDARTVVFPAKVVRRQAWLELLLAARGGKTHESTFVTNVAPKKLHFALLMIGFDSDAAPHLIAPDPGKNTFVSAHEDQVLRLWNSKANTPDRRLYAHPGTSTALAVHPEGSPVASGTENGSILLWDPDQGSVQKTIEAHDQSVTDLAFDPEGTVLLSASEGGDLHGFDTEQYDRMFQTSYDQAPITRIHPLDKPDTVLVSTRDGVISRLRINENSPSRNEVGRIEQTTITDLAATPEGKYFVAVGRTRKAYFWTPETESDKPRTFQKHDHPITSVAIDQSNKDASPLIVTGDTKGNLLKWTPASKTNPEPLSGHKGAVNDLAFSTSNSTLYSASPDQRIRLYQPRKNDEVLESFAPAPPRFFGDPRIPVGDPLIILVEYQLDNGKWVRFRLEDLTRNIPEERVMRRLGFVFSGSEFRTRKVEGGRNKKEFAASNVKTLIASYHDPSAIIDLPGYQGGSDTVYQPRKEVLPPAGSSARMIIRHPKGREYEEIRSAFSSSMEQWKESVSKQKLPEPRRQK